MPKKFSHIASRGSVLVFSLIVLSFLLIAGLSLASLSVIDQKTASSTDRSTISFQAADSAAELILQKIYKDGPYTSLNNLCEDIDAPNHSNEDPCCTDGVLAGDLNNGGYRVSFYDNGLGTDNDPSAHKLDSCSDADWRTDAVYLKSEGIYGGTTRAIQLVIQAP